MGLDERLNLRGEIYHETRSMPDDKINPIIAGELASQLDRIPKLDYAARISPDDGFLHRDREPRKYAVERIKNLIRVAQKVYCLLYKNNEADKANIQLTPDQRRKRKKLRQENLQAYPRQIAENGRFLPEDLNLCTPAINIFKHNPHFKKLAEGFEHKTLRAMFLDDRIDAIMAEFNRNGDHVFGKDPLGITSSFLHDLMRWTANYANRDVERYTEFQLLSKRLNFLSRELHYGESDHVYQDLILDNPLRSNDKVVSILTSTDIISPETMLVARLNNSAAKVMTNEVDCCITGPHGKHSATTLLYWLDPAVYTWEFYAAGEHDTMTAQLPFGLGIFFKARGHHSSTKESTDYLVFEGFPANSHKYAHIGTLGTLNAESLSKELRAFALDPQPNVSFAETPFTLPELVYALGIATAKKLGIPKMLINTEHGERTQYSVRHSLNEIMRITGNSAIWDADAQKLLKDPLTADGRFAEFEAHARTYDNQEKTKKFAYTHFIKKPPLPPHIIQEIKSPVNHRWRGEILLDTTFPWTTFVGKAYRTWPTTEDGFNPHDWRGWHVHTYFNDPRGQLEPCWNLGIGYCRGIEVDVEKECARLKLK